MGIFGNICPPDRCSGTVASHLLVSRKAMSSTSTALALPLLSAVMLTRNRVKRCLDCVRYTAGAMRHMSSSILVINNGRSDVPLPGSVDGVPCRVINTGRNLGAAARNISLAETDSEFLVMLDDDAYVERESVEAMLRTFESDPRIGAVGFRVKDGSCREESCLLPTIFHGCACGFRASALKKIGGYPSDFLYYGEEYSVAFRLYQAGYRIVTLDGPPRVFHARDADGRDKNKIIELLVANNVRLWTESMPWRYVPMAIGDTLRRYAYVSKKESAKRGFLAGCARMPNALLRGLLRRRPIPGSVFKRVVLLEQLSAACRRLEAAGNRPLAVCGTGKFPSFWLRALKTHGLRVAAFLDMNPCWRGAALHGIPVLVPNTQDPLSIRRLIDDMDGHLFLTGLSSLSENTRWRAALGDAGKSDCAAPVPTEESARDGIFDLLGGTGIGFFSNSRSGPAIPESACTFREFTASEGGPAGPDTVRGTAAAGPLGRFGIVRNPRNEEMI